MGRLAYLPIIIGAPDCLTEEQEPNDSRSDANKQSPLCQGTSIQGRLDQGDSADFYRLVVGGGTTTPVVLEMRDIPAGTNYNLQLLDAANALQGYSANPGTSDERIEANLPPGTYYLYVYAENMRDSSDAPYTVQWLP